MRFTKTQVAAEKNRAADRVRSTVRHRKFLSFVFGAIIGAGAMYATLKPEDVKQGYHRVREWVLKEDEKVKKHFSTPTTQDANIANHVVHVTPAATQPTE